MAFAALLLSIVIAVAVTRWSTEMLLSGLLAAVTGGVGIALTGLLNGPIETIRAQDPERVLAADRTVAAATAIFAGFTAFVTIVRVSGLWPALVATTAAAIAAAIGMSSWGWFLLARLYFWSIFWSRRRLPAALMTFLSDAHLRGVLRQSGTVYQFRHRRLQARLAVRDEITIERPEAERPESDRDRE
jgi:hypothetical protein